MMANPVQSSLHAGEGLKFRALSRVVNDSPPKVLVPGRSAKKLT